MKNKANYLFIALLLIFCCLLCAAISTLAVTPTTLKVADKPDYEKYLAYCNDSITVDIVQYGKATVVAQNVPGLDFEMAKMMPGSFTNAMVRDTVWYAPWKPGSKATAYSITSNQVRIERLIKVKVQRRIPSVKDFYASWKTNLIKH